MLELKEFLKTLGSSAYESSAYCTIIENGPMKATDLAIKAGIPQGRIYEVITSLTGRGWLKRTGTRPTIYDAQNPRRVLEAELDTMQKKMARSLQDAEQAWELRTGRIGDADDKSWTVSGVHGIVLEIRNLCASAKKSIKIVDSSISWLGSKDFHKFEDMIKDGMNISIVSTKSSLTELKRFVNVGSNAYVTKSSNLSFYIIDDEIVLMKLNNPDNGTIVRDSNLTAMFVDKFNGIVKNATKVEGAKVVS